MGKGGIYFSLSCVIFFLSSCVSYKVPTNTLSTYPRRVYHYKPGVHKLLAQSKNLSSSLQRIYEIAQEEKRQRQLSKRSDLKKRALDHWLYHYVPRHRSQMHFYDMPRWFSWSFLGNDEDGIFGEEQTANYKTQRDVGLLRFLTWTLRNPLHNFNFYVIGSAHRQNSEFALLKISDSSQEFMTYKGKATTVFPGKNHGFFLGFHGAKPFISLHAHFFLRFQFYLGWREKGNFGIKFAFRNLDEV